ncbi:hypothetical protein DFP73DRAFT_610046 [Morchella snyderi]|nr:hypothetical protein DFP73DRAFT_610046 [Morchella snyderi]
MGRIEKAVQHPQRILAARGGPDHVSPDRNAVPHRPTNGKNGNANLHPLGTGRFTESGKYRNTAKNLTSSGGDGPAQGATPASSSSVGFMKAEAQGHVYIPTEPVSMRKRILSPGQEGAKRRRLHEMDSIIQTAASSTDEGTWRGGLGDWSLPGASAAYGPALQQHIKYRQDWRGQGPVSSQGNVWDHEAGGACRSSENPKAKKAPAIPSTAGHALPGPRNGAAMKDLLRRLDIAKKVEIIRDENIAWNNEHPNQPRLLNLRGSYLKEEFLVFTEYSVICEVCIMEMAPLEREAHIRQKSHKRKVECMKKERDWLENFFNSETIVID